MAKPCCPHSLPPSLNIGTRPTPGCTWMRPHAKPSVTGANFSPPLPSSPCRAPTWYQHLQHSLATVMPPNRVLVGSGLVINNPSRPLSGGFPSHQISKMLSFQIATLQGPSPILIWKWRVSSVSGWHSNHLLTLPTAMWRWGVTIPQP